MTPADLGLPYPKWQPGQWDLVVEIITAFDDDHPFVIVEAPTGTGKSAVALAAARMMGDRTVILTGTKQLQDQYASMGADVEKLLGRGNFVCNITPTLMADQAICTVGGVCSHKGKPTCDYYGQLAKAQESRDVVLNYPLWLAQANYTHRFTKPALLVCDEAHTLDDEIRKFATVQFYQSTLESLEIPWPSIGPDPAAWRNYAMEIAARLYSEWKQTTQQRSGLSDRERERRMRVRRVYQAAVTLANPELASDGWVVELDTRDSGRQAARFRPVWVSPLMPKVFNKHVGKVLFMSATILNKEMFCAQLGIPETKVRFIRVPSTFNVESRPLYYAPIGKVRGQDSAGLKRLVLAVDDLLDRHPTERGILHTVSYRIAKAIAENSRHKGRLITHGAGDRLTQLGKFRETPGAVLVSPSMTTGVDLPYDLCRFQVICKLAFPDLADPQIKKRMKIGPDGQPNARGQSWYNWVTACTLVQTYGRGMRAADDACVTYLLDGNWGWFRKTVRDMLPSWFSAAIINVPPPLPPDEDEMIATIKRWAAA